MGVLRELLNGLSQFFKWWIVIAPWEQALRVRGGKRSKLLLAGVHFRIPFWDRVYRQSVRMRAASIPAQTLSTTDGFAVEVRLCLMYQIEDMEQLYESVENPDALGAMAASAVADYVTTRRLEDLSVAGIEDAASAAVPLKEFGLKAEEGRFAVRVIDVVFLKRTYRLITGNIAKDGYWDSLNLTRYVGQQRDE